MGRSVYRIMATTALSVALLAAAAPAFGTHTQPVPIPGGIQIPDGPQIHIWLPGPTDITLPFSGSTLMGLDVEPSTITDRKGFTALGYVIGTATDAEGNTFNMEVDLRVFRGKYVAANGTTYTGTFAMI